MATSSPRHQSRQILGLPPLIVEYPPSSSEPDSPSSGNRSPRSHTESVWTTNDSSFPEDFFIEGFLPHFNPPLTNLLDPLLIPAAAVLPVSVGGTFPSIPSMTNGSWNFADTFGPPPFLQSTVTTTPSMANPAIPFVLGKTTHMTPSTSGTQLMPGSTPVVSNYIPSTSATYNTPYNAQYSNMGTIPIHQQYGQPPLYSSNPQIQVSRGIPNMHMSVGNITVPPLFSGMHGQSPIDMSIPYVNQGQMVSSMTGRNPQGGPNQSMGAPYSQIQMSQGGTAYPRGNSIPQNQNPHGNPHYNAIPQGNYYTTQPMYNIGNQTMGGAQGSSSQMSSPWSESGAPHSLSFLAKLDILDLYKLTNDPI